MTHDEQFDWMQSREYKDPYWAHREYEIRRQAADVMRRLYENDGNQSVSVYIMSPGNGSYGFKQDVVTIFKHDVVRVGGLEGTLMVEEMIRRAAGMH